MGVLLMTKVHLPDGLVASQTPAAFACMKLCGWRTIESAMRYLAKAQSKQVRKQVNAVFGETPSTGG